MIKDNMRIKESITLQDRINAIETIVSFYFMDGDYTPYYKDEGEISATYSLITSIMSYNSLIEF